MRSHSQAVWDLDWSRHLPRDLADGIRVELVSYDEATEFVRDHYGHIFRLGEKDERFLPDPTTPAKRRFLEHADKFMFRHGGRPIGLLIGHPADWSTYYWRTAALLPSFQGSGIIPQMDELTSPIMAAHGVERLELEVSPTNERQLRFSLRAGYRVTGTINSERWGALLRLTKFLSARSEETFNAQFCREKQPARRVGDPHAMEGANHEEVRPRNAVVDGISC